MNVDVLALGELLIDFSVVPSPEGTTSSLRGSAGGAPANVLAAICRLGGTGQLIAKVGQDPFGDFLESCIADAKISTESILRDPHRTTLAFVTLDQQGERSFSFERNPGADTQIREDDLHQIWFDQAKVFHFGSLSLTAEPARTATYAAIERAKAAGCVVSFDPNLREPLWRDLDEAKRQMTNGAALADVVKVSEEELAFLTGEPEMENGIDAFQEVNPTARLIVTRGPRGAAFKSAHGLERVPSIEVQAIDTTAAGDAFFGAFLYYVTHAQTTVRACLLDDATTLEATRFAAIAGALTTTKRGAFDALPRLEEISAHLSVL
ncbi:carbohydrate kinase family protein [Alicyclobacillus acidiphilus]|uniref:carbohydrate kinase family protein n=1 Tax=Alicyclobacillus acidiphilus TaxID=182455 RepID=UPI00082BBB50|nr:carbohydrate kinase [Alicyclobacillus acidiphilus]